MKIKTLLYGRDEPYILEGEDCTSERFDEMLMQIGENPNRFVQVENGRFVRCKEVEQVRVEEELPSKEVEEVKVGSSE